MFPAALLILIRLQRQRLGYWLAAATLLSFALCLYGTGAHPEPTFYLLPTRVWELLVGATLAVSRTLAPGGQEVATLGASRHSLEIVGWGGIVVVIVGFIFINDGHGFPGLVSLAPTVGTAFVLFAVVDGKTSLSNLLASPMAVGIGRRSYSIYLWHWPLITLGKSLADFSGQPQVLGSIAGGITGVLVASLVYAGIEQPLRKPGQGRSRRLMSIGGGFAVAAACAALAGSRHPAADPAGRFDRPAFFGELYDAGDASNAIMARSVAFSDVYLPPLSADSGNSWRTGGIVHRYGSQSPQVVVLGSSHALMYSKVIDDICRSRGLSVAFLAVGRGTPAFFTATRFEGFSSDREAREFDSARKRWLREWHPALVLMIDRWDERFTPRNFDRDLRSFLEEVTPLTGRIVFVAQVPAVVWGDRYNLRELVGFLGGHDGSLPDFAPDGAELFRRKATAFAEAAMADFPKLRVLRADLPFYYPNGSIRYASGRNFFYADDDHLTESGAEELRGSFQQAIAAATAGIASSAGRH